MIKSSILCSLACLGMALSVDAQVCVDPIPHASAVVSHVGVGGDATGHWETIRERVWVPGHYDQVVIPARYGWVVDSCGHRVWGLISPERCERVWHPGQYEWQERRVWVPACRTPVVRIGAPDHRRGIAPGRGRPAVRVASPARGRPVLRGRRR